VGDFTVKEGRDSNFKLTVRNDSSHKISNDTGVRGVKLSTPTDFVVKSTMFSHRSVHRYTWSVPEGKAHNQINHVLLDIGWHSSMLDVRSFRGPDCDIGPDHCLVVAKVRERLAVSCTEDRYGEIQFQEVQ
jgi:hypothetical protein